MKVQIFYEHLHKIIHLVPLVWFCSFHKLMGKHMSDFAHMYKSSKFCFNNYMYLSLDHHPPLNTHDSFQV
jgi:hypothetical protein